MLLAQGLSSANPFGHGKAGVLNAIQHLGYVQLDTISVVERAHHHVIWSRVPDFQQRDLHTLQAIDREVFEYWSHAASFLPIKDFRFSLPRMKLYSERQNHWFKKDKKVMQQVLSRIKAEGPLLSKDFEPPKGSRTGPWFEWKPAKKALEQLFMEGRLMIKERRGFQKVYDLTERVLPSSVNSTFPTRPEQIRHLVRQTLQSQGLATENEIRYLRKGIQKDLTRTLKELKEGGMVIPLRIHGIENATYYAMPEALLCLENDPSPSDFENQLKVRVLSPFDNLVIQRKRLKALFDFDYQIECYLPEQKRKFGYFCLPLLWGDRFIGRIDAKADRPRRALQVKGLYLEIKRNERSSFRELVDRGVLEFARFNGCDRVE